MYICMSQKFDTSEDSPELETTEANIESVTGDVVGLEAVCDLMVGDETEEFANLASEQIAFYGGWSELGYEKTLDLSMQVLDGYETVEDLPQIRLFESTKFEDARAVLVYFDYSSDSEDVTRYWAVADDTDAEEVVSDLINETRNNCSDEDGEFTIFNHENSFGIEFDE